MELNDLVDKFLFAERVIYKYKDYYGASINKKFVFNNYEDYQNKYLGFFKSQEKLKDVIAYACFGVFRLKLNDEMYTIRHSHQEYFMLENGKFRGLSLKDALLVTKRIQARAVELKGVLTFQDLFNLISDCRNEQFGRLSIYDAAVRIGAFIGLEPEVVYIHTGVKVGVRILEEKGYTKEQLSNREFAPIEKFPEEMHRLSPLAIENMTCEAKKDFESLPTVFRQ